MKETFTTPLGICLTPNIPYQSKFVPYDTKATNYNTELNTRVSTNMFNIILILNIHESIANVRVLIPNPQFFITSFFVISRTIVILNSYGFKTPCKVALLNLI